MDIISISNYIKELKIKSKADYINNPIELIPLIINEYNQEHNSIELKNYDIQYFEYIWSLFKLIFWDNETVSSLKDSLIGPFGYEIEDRFEWKTINLSNQETRFLKPRPCALYDIDTKKFYYINKLLKNNIFQNKFFENTTFEKNNILDNVTNKQADQIALHFRVAFYSSLIYLDTYNTHNLICSEIEYQPNKWVKIYSLIDYGIPEPEYEQQISDKCGTISNLLCIFRLSCATFYPKN